MELITVKEASEILGVSTATIRRYIQAGKLEALKYSRDIKVNKKSLEDFINQSKIGGTENE